MTNTLAQIKSTPPPPPRIRGAVWLACLIAISGCGGGGGGGGNSASNTPSYLIISDRDPVRTEGNQANIWEFDAAIRSNSHNVEVLLVTPSANTPSYDHVSRLAAGNNRDTMTDFVAITTDRDDYLAFGTRYNPTSSIAGGSVTYTGQAFTNFGDGEGVTNIVLDFANNLIDIDITDLGSGFDVELENVRLNRNTGRFEGEGINTANNYATVGQLIGNYGGIIGVLYNTVNTNRGSYFGTPPQ